MKAFKWFTRIAILLLTAVFGILFGIIAPFAIMNMEIEGLSENSVLIVWIVFAVLGYFVPSVLFNLNLYKLSACFSALGTCLMLYIHSVISNSALDASFMYLPQMFVTILTVLYAVIFGFSEHEKRALREKEQKAPSILGE